MNYVNIKISVEQKSLEINCSISLKISIKIVLMLNIIEISYIFVGDEELL